MRLLIGSATPPFRTPSRAARAMRVLFHGALVLSLLACVPAVHAAEEEAPFANFPAALSQPGFDLRDRLEILNLMRFYSHLADGLHTEQFGEFFTENAIFKIVPYGHRPNTPLPIMGKTRAKIVAALKPRHDAFRRDSVQRRHFLTNPIVWDQTDKSARVAVYLQLHSTTDGGPPSIVATGRYVGLAVKVLEGWRIAEWTLHSDQSLE
jgi:hypothetical protein